MAAAAHHYCSSAAVITGQVGYRRLPLRGLDLCLSRCLSTSHYPCQRGAVPAQSCIHPAACRSRVFTELSLRCTTMVRPRDDYSMTATATVRLASATATRATTKLLPWQMLLAFTTDGQDETARASSAASERALVAGRFRGDVNGGRVLARSSAHACSGSSNQGSADYYCCSGRLQIKRAQSINNSPALAPGTRHSNLHRASPTL